MIISFREFIPIPIKFINRIPALHENYWKKLIDDWKLRPVSILQCHYSWFLFNSFHKIRIKVLGIKIFVYIFFCIPCLKFHVSTFLLYQWDIKGSIYFSDPFIAHGLRITWKRWRGIFLKFQQVLQFCRWKLFFFSF